MFGGTTEDDHWLGDRVEKKTKEKLGTKLISEVSSKHKLMSNTFCRALKFNILTSETVHGKSKTELAALNFRATKLPKTLAEHCTI